MNGQGWALAAFVWLVCVPLSFPVGAYIGKSLAVRDYLAPLPHDERPTYISWEGAGHFQAPDGCVLLQQPRCKDQSQPCTSMKTSIACQYGLPPGVYEIHRFGEIP